MQYLISLGLTLVFELALALIWRVEKRDLLLISLTNVLTNPLVVLVHNLLLSFGFLLHTLLPELVAIGTEAAIYCRRENRINRPVLFAVAANVLSYSLGLLLQQLL